MMYTFNGLWIMEIYIVLACAVFMNLPQRIKAFESVAYEFNNIVGGPGFPRTPWRAGSSSGSSLRLFEGDKIKLTLCLKERSMIEFSGLTYSNDGGSDSIYISLDNDPFTSFETTELLHGWGKYWNEFKSSGLLGAKLLEKGNHTVDLLIASSDCYGSEFDAFHIMLDERVDSKLLFCEAELFKSQTPSPCAVLTDSTVIKAPKINDEKTLAKKVTTMSTPTTAVKETLASMTQFVTSPDRTPETKTTTTAPGTMNNINITPKENVVTEANKETTVGIVTSAIKIRDDVTTEKHHAINPSVQTTIGTLHPSETKMLKSDTDFSSETVTSSSILPISKVKLPTKSSSRKIEATTDTTVMPTSSEKGSNTTEETTVDNTNHIPGGSFPTFQSSISTSGDKVTTSLPRASGGATTLSATSKAFQDGTMTTKSSGRVSASGTKLPTTLLDTSTLTAREETHTTTSQIDVTQKSVTESTPTQNSTQPKTTRRPGPSLEQLSFQTECLNVNNVGIRFSSESLTKVEIITRPSLSTKNDIQPQRTANKNISRGHLCNEDVIWQIGQHDKSNFELGPARNEQTIDYDVNLHAHNVAPFPSEISPGKTKTIVLRYLIPERTDLKQRKVYFTLGLINVSKKVIIGLQYIDRAKKEVSDIQFKTLKEGKRMLTWAIPTKSISPLLENQLHVHIADDNPTLQIDYMALEYADARTKTVLIANVPKWKIRGKKYITYRKQKIAVKTIEKPKDMLLRIDEKVQKNMFEEVSLIYKPNWKVLTVHKNGKIMPQHQNQQLKRKSKSRASTTEVMDLPGATGFTFGENDIMIANVSFDSKRSVLSLIYEDFNFVELLLQYSRFRTKIQIINSSFKKLNYFSTYISDNVSAINRLVVDDSIRTNITDRNISGIKGNKFRFMNTVQNSVFDTSNEYELLFVS